MRNTRAFLAVLLALLTVVLAGCGVGTDKAASVVPTADVTAEARMPYEVAGATAEEPVRAAVDGLQIPVSSLSAEPTFIDWAQDGTAMQLIALKDGSGEVRLAYNTCQVCAGSPLAYFAYEDGELICQNCGNQFALDAVGKDAGGCNPKPVAEFQVNGDSIEISGAVLAKAVPDFKNWKVF